MSLIRELGKNLDVVTQLVAKMRSAINTCESDSNGPTTRIGRGSEDVSGETKQVQTRLAEMDGLIAQVKTQLAALSQDLDAETKRLASEGMQRVDAMEKNTTEVQGRFQVLTQAVKHTMEEVDQRAERLRTAAAQLSESSREQGENLDRDYKAGTAALENSAEIVKAAYPTDLFGDLARRLQVLQADLDHDTADLVPGASRKLGDVLAGEHTNGVKDTFKSFSTTVQATLSDYLGQTQQIAARMREAEEADVQAADELVRQALPDQAKAAATKADNAVRAMVGEMTALSKYATEQSNFMTAELKPWQEAIEQLHIALEHMIGGKGK